MTEDLKPVRKIYYWRCQYIRFDYKGFGEKCLLGKKEFGTCDKCEVYTQFEDEISKSLGPYVI